MALILISLDFSPSALDVLLNVDASPTIGWGGVLSQLQVDGTLQDLKVDCGVTPKRNMMPLNWNVVV